jgi:predicted DCC family thiol-disulfide oxidoreductase YuxK
MNDICFIYDGECPLCTRAARAFRIRQAVGGLRLIDGRTERDHPLMKEVNARGIDLDEGMAIFYEGAFYHGWDALHLMALIGSESGWFNRINARLFRSKTAARLCYPPLRGMRNLLLRLKGAGKIDNLDRASRPLFQPIFGADWDRLPHVMKRHYANRPYHDDKVTAEGVMRVESSPLGRLLTPLFMLAGTLVPYEGDNVPSTVHFVSSADSDAFGFERTFHFPGRPPFRFRSHMKPAGGNVLVEFMRFGLGWRMAYEWDGAKIVLAHKGYVLGLFGILIPLPLALIMGRGYAEETPLSDDEFSMMMEIRHPLWGKVYGYSGRFRITKDA